jgi:hypothetical protein
MPPFVFKIGKLNFLKIIIVIDGIVRLTLSFTNGKLYKLIRNFGELDKDNTFGPANPIFRTLSNAEIPKRFMSMLYVIVPPKVQMI